MIRELDLPGVREITPVRHGDHRGFFSETYNTKTFAGIGLSDVFVQDNHARSAAAGTVRGMHFQIPPHAAAKLVRVVVGSVFDVAVDIRQGSQTYGRHASVVLTAEKGNQMYVPAGFAHGYMTLEPDTEVVYKVTEHWYPESDRGFVWNDPEVGIDWPSIGARATLSAKDRDLPPFSALDAWFTEEDNS